MPYRYHIFRVVLCDAEGVTASSHNAIHACRPYSCMKRSMELGHVFLVTFGVAVRRIGGMPDR